MARIRIRLSNRNGVHVILTMISVPIGKPCRTTLPTSIRTRGSRSETAPHREFSMAQWPRCRNPTIDPYCP